METALFFRLLAVHFYSEKLANWYTEQFPLKDPVVVCNEDYNNALKNAGSLFYLLFPYLFLAYVRVFNGVIMLGLNDNLDAWVLCFVLVAKTNAAWN